MNETDPFPAAENGTASLAYDYCVVMIGEHPYCGGDRTAPGEQQCMNDLAIGNQGLGGLSGHTLEFSNFMLQESCSEANRFLVYKDHYYVFTSDTLDELCIALVGHTPCL